MWGATGRGANLIVTLDISIHAPRVGRDAQNGNCPSCKQYFNPRAPCGARHVFLEQWPEAKIISIHAPRVGRDLQRLFSNWRVLFQSTRPVWGATFPLSEPSALGADFNPRAPCGARRVHRRVRFQHCNFNPRAPCGARLCHGTGRVKAPKFQSTRPVWGATNPSLRQLAQRTYFNPRAPCGARRSTKTSDGGTTYISIHAPRVGRDPMFPSQPLPCIYFNPRAPCGARPNKNLALLDQVVFQSTRPVWGATYAVAQNLFGDCISIHAPRVGRDVDAVRTAVHNILFQSTRPVWGATAIGGIVNYSYTISIHAPRVGRDSKFDDFTPSNLHKRYKRVLARPKNTREKGKIKQKLAYIHAFSAFLGCEGSGTFCALVLRTQYR